MNLVPITEFLVKSVVKNPDLVSVKQYDDEEILLEVLASSEDMPTLIGRQGSVASAIRTMVIAYSCNTEEKNHKKIKITFDSF